jgi:hypothetical protein
LTVTVQLVAWLSATVVGVQERVVAVECNALICTVVFPLLAAWTVSAGAYVPVIVAVPVVEPAVNVTEQLPADRVQLVGLNVPIPVGATVKLTVPVGTVAPAPSMSATVAVHDVDPPTLTDEGLQETVVEVLLSVAVTEPLVAPLLALPR